MRVTVDSQAHRGLSFLPGVPAETVCLIEGRNGIGKTMTVRLLQLIAGHQAFETAPQQWYSMQARIGRTRVALSELTGGQTLTVTFTPEDWPQETDHEGNPVVPVVLGEWLGEASLDGKRISLEQAQELLWVERIALNEDLAVTLQNRLRVYETRASAAGTTIRRAVDLIDRLLSPLLDRLRRLEPQLLKREQQELQELERHEAAARAGLDQLVERHATILNALDARNRLTDAGSRAKEWQQRRKDIARLLSENTEAHRQAEHQLEQATKNLQRHGDVQATLTEARRLQRHRLKRKRNIEAELHELERVLGIEASADAVALLRQDVSERIKRLEFQRREVDAAGQTARLVDRLDSVLSSDTALGLEDQPLVVRDNGDLTVGEVRSGLERRAVQLASEPRPDELRELLRRLQHERITFSRVTELAGKIGDHVRQLQLLDEADEAVVAAAKRAEQAGGEDQQIKELSRKVASLEDEAERLALELSELNANLGLEGGRSAEDAEDDLRRTLAALKLTGEQLDAAEVEARSLVEKQAREREAISERASAIRRSVTLKTAEIDAELAALQSDSALRWVLDDEEIKQALADPGRKADAMIELKRKADDVDARVQRAQGVLAQLETVAATAMRDNATQTELTAPILEVLDEELRRGLDQEAIRRLVFDGARLATVDAARRELVLVGDDGVDDRRGFDTFSTGEQAFAFTQARILELQPAERPNRVLVLDEFGAFVAADRMPELADFLRKQAVGEIADQILVILPLQADYEAQLKDTRGALRERYSRRVEQINACGYFTEPL